MAIPDMEPVEGTIVKGEFQGQRAKVKGSEGWFYHCQVVTASGEKVENGLVSVHRSAIVIDSQQPR